MTYFAYHLTESQSQEPRLAKGLWARGGSILEEENGEKERGNPLIEAGRMMVMYINGYSLVILL